jgi:hypothetical protein
MGTHLTLRLLGPPEVRLGGELAVGLASNKVRALLYYFSVQAGRLHHRESLAGLLWPDDPEHSARTNLSSSLSSLRATLGDRHAACVLLDIWRQVTPLNSHGGFWADAAASGLPAWGSGTAQGGKPCLQSRA